MSRCYLPTRADLWRHRLHCAARDFLGALLVAALFTAPLFAHLLDNP